MSLEENIKAVRRFNRSVTRKIGALQEGLLHSSLSLPEARIIYELYHCQEITLTQLAKELELDLGYLSRLITKLETGKYIQKKASDEDARQKVLSLTSEGTKAAEILDRRSKEEVTEMLNQLSREEQTQLLSAMSTIEELFGGYKYAKPYFLRPHRLGDVGLITHLHGKHVSPHYGWGEPFEALVGKITSDFQKNYQPERERCIVAERNGEMIGCIFLVDDGKNIGKLRLLYVSPDSRGLGLGKRLVDEVICFAKEVGYDKIMLWTNDILKPARHIYSKAGFQLVHEEPNEEFGEGLIGETWELKL